MKGSIPPNQYGSTPLVLVQYTRLCNISSSEARSHASLGLRSTQVRILPIRHCIDCRLQASVLNVTNGYDHVDKPDKGSR